MKINSQKTKSLFLLSLLSSGSANKKKSVLELTNQTNVSYPNLGWADFFGKISSANFTNEKVAEETSDNDVIFAGYPMSVVGSVGNKKNCTVGYFLVAVDTSDCTRSQDSYAFITSSLCCVSNSDCTDNIQFLNSSNQDRVRMTTFTDDITQRNGNDFALVGAGSYGIPYVAGLTTNDKTVSEIYPVTTSSSPRIGVEICAYGVSSGYLCGNLTAFGKELIVPSPWTGGSNITFKDVNEVDLGANGFEGDGDIGGSVYYLSRMEGQKIVAVVLGHITGFNNDDPNHKFLYYTPISEVLGSLNQDGCLFSLLTSNDLSAKEFQAQVEVPLKN